MGEGERGYTGNVWLEGEKASALSGDDDDDGVTGIGGWWWRCSQCDGGVGIWMERDRRAEEELEDSWLTITGYDSIRLLSSGRNKVEVVAALW